MQAREILWAEREWNPHSPRRLIYSHRPAQDDRPASFLTISRFSITYKSNSTKSQLPILFSTEREADRSCPDRREVVQTSRESSDRLVSHQRSRARGSRQEPEEGHRSRRPGAADGSARPRR